MPPKAPPRGAAPPVAAAAATVDGSNSSTFKTILQMLIITVGIYGSFSWWSVLQERVATQPYDVDGEQKKFTYSFVTSLFGAISSTILSFIFCVLQQLFGSKDNKKTSVGNKNDSSLPWRQLFFIGFTVCYGAPFGYAAMSYVSYPVVLTLKMCKMIPVVVVGVLVHRTKYSRNKYISLILVTAGVMGFMMLGDDKKKSSKTDDSSSSDILTMAIGTILCFINLTFDGYTNSTQDLVNKKYSHIFNNPFKLMLSTNFFSVVVGLISLVLFEFVPQEYTNKVIQRQLFDAIAFVQAQPAVMFDLLLMGALGAIGQSFIFLGLNWFGSLTVVAITVVRKIGSVCLSIWINNHSVTPLQLVSLVATCSGIVLDTYSNIKGKKKKD